MDVQKMRVALERKYNKAFVKNMKDAQVVAVYKRLQSQNKI